MLKRLVIVNSTPIIALAAIDRLDILKALYGQVIIPKAVHDEIVFKEDSIAKHALAKANEWIITKSITNNEAKRFFKIQLHDGEVEVMILGKELEADLLIIDDYTAREYAKHLDLKITGTIGVILKAKEIGIITEVKPLISKLIENGIYISDKLFNDILKKAGE